MISDDIFRNISGIVYSIMLYEFNAYRKFGRTFTYHFLIIFEFKRNIMKRICKQPVLHDSNKDFQENFTLCEKISISNDTNAYSFKDKSRIFFQENKT